MKEFDDRLHQVEMVMKEKLGAPGESGQIERRMDRIDRQLRVMDQSLRGNGEPGLTERMRSLENWRRAGREGDRSLIDRVTRLEYGWRLLIGALAVIGSGVLFLVQQWISTIWIGG